LIEDLLSFDPFGDNSWQTMAKTMGKIALKGLVSLVTGSASGLGSQVRQRLAMKGSKVLAVDINHKTIIEEDVELKSRVSFITGDVTDERFLNDLFTKYPKCDAVVNCAAAYRCMPHMLTVKTIQRIH
jgi:NAD(P)-dependent dehydrogenase (short-subunit alcohol dehydrogenase family)